MAVKRLLYVAPHLSTGGMPQYLYKQIIHFKENYLVGVIEHRNLAGSEYVVQKNRIMDVVQPCFVTLNDDSERALLIDRINDFKPDIIHFTEIPEHFIDTNVLDVIFDNDTRYYDIVVSTHGSKTNPDNIKYHPDRYVMPSEWSRLKFEHLGIETFVWEYPIENLLVNKEYARNKLMLDGDVKHVLMVGLFTEGKNQAEIFNVARKLEKYKILFHFVGNMALNFEDYWKPLIESKPTNCVIWGERDDVHLFYQACDLFYFSSKMELNPLSIKEALSYKMPCIFKKLETYMDSYDNNDLVTYIDDNLESTKNIILTKLNPELGEIPGWFSYQSVYDKFVAEAKDGDTIVEVGSWFGKSTNYLLSKHAKEHNKNLKIYSIDTFKGSSDETIHAKIVDNFDNDIYCEFVENLSLFSNLQSIEVIKESSVEASKLFRLNSIDYIMIDASHEYNDVKNDLNEWFPKVKSGGYISGDDYKVFKGVTDAVDEYFYGQITVDGYTFLRKKPRIQIIHLLTEPDALREQTSRKSITQLKRYGMDYLPIVNKVYNDIPPKEGCRRPEHISIDNKPGELWEGAGLGWITGRHYGCYLAHASALKSIDTVNYDYTLVFEADAYIYTNLSEFVDAIYKSCFISERDDVYYIGLANNPSMEKVYVDDMFSKTAFNQDLAHAYIIPNRTKDWWISRLNDCAWDVGDLWYNHVFANHPKARYTTNKVYCKQVNGNSLIDQVVKEW